MPDPGRQHRGRRAFRPQPNKPHSQAGARIELPLQTAPYSGRPGFGLQFMLELHPCSEDISEWGYRLHLADGSTVPYGPYHGYDDQLFQGALESLRGGEWLACRVREVSCFGEDGNDDNPEF